MKGTIAWIIFGISALTCLLWIGSGVRDDLREDAVFHNVIKERTKRINSTGDLLIGVAGDWSRHQRVLEGIRAGVEEVNKAGGILSRTVRLDVQDDHGTIEGALNVAQTFASNPDIALIIGHTSPKLNGAVAQNYEFYQLLNLSPSATTTGNENYKLQFSNGLAPKALGNSLLDLAQAQGWTRIGLVYTKSDYHQRQARLFESLADKRQVNIPLSFAYAGQDMTPEMKRWHRELGLDALVFSLGLDDTQKLIQLMRDAGMHQPIVTTGQQPNLPASNGNDRLYSLHGGATDNSSPVSEHALGYESVLLLARASRESGSLAPEKLAEALHGLHLVPPIKATTSFDDSGNAIKIMPTFSCDTPAK